MKAVVQRVKNAALTVDGKLVSSIGCGLVVFLGVKRGDGQAQALRIAQKVAALRIFEDDGGKMNLALKDVGGEVLLVSQFTLYGDASHGNRPSFTLAEEPVKANALYEYCAQELCALGVSVSCGVFGADMQITQHNDGPVTIILEID